MREVRIPDVYYLKIKMVFVQLIFTRCEKCGLEFRKANMWSYKKYDYREYLCTDCAPDYWDVLKHVLGKEKVKKLKLDLKEEKRR